jgi:plastocyanin
VKLRRAAVFALAAGVFLLMPAARAATHAATIASFSYTPNDVAISVGDTVVWRNLDATVHTVTASRGEFSSGSMRQGQEFSATFNVPGLYPYFCEPHEFMRGTVSVTGPAPSTTTVVATTTTTRVIGAITSPAITTTTVPVIQPLPTTRLPSNATGSTAPTPVAVVATGVSGTADQPSAALPVGALLLIGAAVAAALRRDRLHYAAAAATAATGLLHAQLRFALDYPEPIGTLLVIEVAAAAVLTAWLVVHPWSRTKQLVGIGAHVAALGALVITRTSVGLFGFHEIGWDPSPQLPLAVAIGAIAIAMLSGARPADTVT